MLWYKAWLETRWRFLIGLLILILSVMGTVFAYPRVEKLLPLVASPSVGQTFGMDAAIAHGICAFSAAAVLFSATSLLSTVFTDLWRPALIVCGVATAIGVCEPFFGEFQRYSLFGLMDGET